MIQVISPVYPTELSSSDTAEFSLKFVEDIDYEFVGGGNAVNGF